MPTQKTLTPKRERQLTRYVRRELRALRIEAPLDIEVLEQALERRRGKPILASPTHLPARVTGASKSFAEFDVVLYESETTAPHQVQIMLHEFGHLVLGHPDDDLGDAEEFVTLGARKELAPHLPAEFIQGTMYRSCDDPTYEQEVELWATIVREWDQRVARLVPARTPGSVGRLDLALSDHVGWN